MLQQWYTIGILVVDRVIQLVCFVFRTVANAGNCDAVSDFLSSSTMFAPWDALSISPHASTVNITIIIFCSIEWTKDLSVPLI